MSENIQSIILAAGKGTRMKSSLPKVLNTLAAKPLLVHVIETAKMVSNNVAVVVGHKADLVRTYCNGCNVYEQTEQLGTGDAVIKAKEFFNDDDLVLILYGDVPLISEQTIKAFISSALDGLSVLTVELKNPKGYGRIVKKDGLIVKIVEEKDATEEERLVKEVNTGILCVKGRLLKGYLNNLSNNNSQNEYYLTDIIAMHVANNRKVNSYICSNEYEVQGINDKWQLAQLERYYQVSNAQRLCLAGVQISDPNRIDIRGNLKTSVDVSIDINCIFEGTVELGSHVIVGANCVIKNSIIGSNTVIKENSSIDGAVIGEDCLIGPFARLRPETILKNDIKIGNFVETKKSNIGNGSKVSHLSYIGDTFMGANVNIGAGTITCNYDGANKFITEIDDDVFVGSSSQLVAPVKLKKGSTIGAGSTITKNVDTNSLVLTRVAQKTVKNWSRPVKKL